jgi:Flp pilus assembly protein TadD
VLAILAALCIFRIITRNRDWKNDVVLYTQTLAAQPEAYHIYNNLGAVYWNQGNVQAAEQEWSKALKLAHDDTFILENLGLLYTRQKRYQEAVDSFIRALQLKPNDAAAHLGLGLAYKEMGLTELAELQLRTAVNLAPLNVRALNGLGEFYLDERRLPAAEAQFQQSLQIQPTLEGYWGLCFVHWIEGDRERAERAFKQAVSLNPSSSRVHFILGLFYGAAGRNEEALWEYDAGLKIDPGNSEAVAALEKLKSRTPNPQTREAFGRREASPRPR